MKGWFVFLIDGARIGFWANSSEEAEQKLKETYGDASAEYLGIYVHGSKSSIEPSKYDHSGMSLCDHMISSGALRMAERLAK